MKFYVIDTTLNPPKEQQFSTYDNVVRYLEGMTGRAYKQTRKQRMIHLEECGHGYDDSSSVTFVRSLADKFEMGIIRTDVGSSRRMKCDITSVSLYQKDEFGN